MIVDKGGGGHDCRLFAEKSEERNWKDQVWTVNLEGFGCEREPRKWSRIDFFFFNGEELRMAQEREYFDGEEQTVRTHSQVCGI